MKESNICLFNLFSPFPPCFFSKLEKIYVKDGINQITIYSLHTSTRRTYFMNTELLLSDFFVQLLVDALDPTKKQKLAAQKRAKQILSTLGISKDIHLTEYEMLIASQLIDPATITVGFEEKKTLN